MLKNRLSLIFLFVLLGVTLILGFTGCDVEGSITDAECEHVFSDAVCTAPMTCSKCGLEKGEASGHKWSEATCSAPKRCANCNQEEGSPLGHDWTAATCTSPERCSVCDTVRGEALGHNGGNATCLDKAVCEVCGEKYGEPTGHDYDESAFGYKDKSGHAHLCTTEGCIAYEGLEAHRSSGAATGSAPEVCLDCGYIITPALGHTEHTPGDTWSIDAEGHWHACTGCNDMKLDVAAHDFENACDGDCSVCGYRREIPHEYEVRYNGDRHWAECALCKSRTDIERHKLTETVTASPTCASAGEKKISCTGCEYEEKVSLIATNIHKYTDGVCTSCGREQGSCDHQKLELKVLGLSEYGLCFDKVSVWSCDCGEVFRLMDIDITDACDWEYYDYNNGIDADGNQYMTQSGTCLDCGAELYLYGVAVIDDNCYTEVTYEITVTKDGVAVFDKATMSMADYIHSYVRGERVEMSQYSSCGGYYTTLVCENCNDPKAEIVDEIRHECDLSGSLTTETLVDENGIEHTVISRACVNCGLTHMMDEYEVRGKACEITGYIAYIVERDGVELFRKEEAEAGYYHDYTYSTTLRGDSCTDGCVITYECVDCGYITFNGSTSHDRTEVYSFANESNDTCRHEFYIEACPCGKEVCVYTSYDDGYECEACSFKLNIETAESYSGCVKVIDKIYEVYYGGECIYEYFTTETEYDHDIVFEATTSGGKAVSLKASCRKCGLSFENSPEYAELEYNKELDGYCYDLEFTPDESRDYTIYSVSDQDTHVTLYRIENGEYKEIGKNDDGGNGNNFLLDAYLEKGYTYVYRIRYYSESQAGSIPYVFVSSADAEKCEHETEEYRVLSSGALSCADGVVVADVCIKCCEILGYNISNYHATESYEYNLVEYGACDGYITIWSCLCGEESRVDIHKGCYDDVKDSDEVCDENGVWHRYIVWSCNRCKKELTEDYYTLKEGCATVEYCDITLKMNGAVVISEVYINGQGYDHDYEYTFVFDNENKAPNCDDGYTVTGVCRDCGYVYSDHLEYHYEYKVYDVRDTENDFCDYHSFLVEKCACGLRYDVSTDPFQDEYKCEECGYRLSYDYEEYIEGCNESSIYTTTLYCDSTEVYKYERIEEHPCHDLTLSSKLLDNRELLIESTCQRCGEISKECETMTVPLLYNDDTGEYMCDLEIAADEDVMYTLFSLTDKDVSLTIYHIVDGAYRELERREYGDFSVYGSIDAGEIYIFRVKYTDSSISDDIRIGYTITATSEFCSHSTERYWTLPEGTGSCEDGMLEVRACERCGDVTEYDVLHGEHSSNRTEIDLTQYGVCSGRIEAYECFCGEERSMIWSDNCGTETYDGSYYDESGREHRVFTYTCDTCQKRFTADIYEEVVGCKYTEYSKCELYIADSLVFEIFEKRGCRNEHVFEYTYDFDNKDGAPNCNEGVTVTYSCKYCDEQYSEHFEEHQRLNQHTDLSDFGACGGYIDIWSCPCGEEAYLDNSAGCYDTEGGEYITDGNGIEHSLWTAECNTCKKTFITDSYTAYEGCYGRQYVKITVLMNGFEVFEKTAVSSQWSEHKFEYEFEFANPEHPNCEDGVTSKRVCKACGFTESEYYDWHYRIEHLYSIDFSEYGACGGRIDFASCPCGEEAYCYTYFGAGERTVYQDENGISHSIYIEECEDCGLYIKEDMYSAKEGCKRYIYRIYTVKIGDTYILNGKTFIEPMDDHNMQYDIVFDDPSSGCEGGVSYTEFCPACGYNNDLGKIYNHWDIECVRIYHFEDYGGCIGHIELWQCPCGENSREPWREGSCAWGLKERSTYEDENGTHFVYTYTCQRCPMEYVKDIYYEVEGCSEYEVTSYSMKIGEQIVFEGYKCRERAGENHDYELTFHYLGEEKSCKGGVEYIYTCKRCQTEDIDTYYHHEEVCLKSYYLADYGACSGWLGIYSCACGEAGYVSYGACGWTSNGSYKDSEGQEYIVYETVCNDCELYIKEVQYIAQDPETGVEYKYADVILMVGGERITEAHLKRPQ